MPQSVLILTHGETSLTFRDRLDFSADNPRPSIQNLVNHLKGVQGGAYETLTIEGRLGETAATATITFTGDPSDEETLVVNGVTFTAQTGSPLSANEFAPGGSAAASASAFVTAFNASASAGVQDVTASAVAGVVTLTADVPGTVGNGFTLSEAMTNVTVSGANFTGGASDQDVTFTVN